MSRKTCAAVLALALVLPNAAYASERPRDCYGIAWCGCWLRHHFGISDKRLNLARNWATLRPRVSGPCVGCIAVWRHHVGVMTAHGKSPSTAVIKSGNDSHAVRERERSIRNVIAWVR
jgi:hypothetical protein